MNTPNFLGLLYGMSWLLFWPLYLLIMRLVRGKRNCNCDDTVFDLVKLRYAKGEINKQEFENIKKDLNA